MAKRRNPPEFIFGKDLSLDEWLRRIGTESGVRIAPLNCFASDEHKSEFLSRISTWDEPTIRQVIRRFLNKSGGYGCDAGHFERVLNKYGSSAFTGHTDTEFELRALPNYGPQWEGLTWVLDLLPRYAKDATSAIGAYLNAHMWYLTDHMIWGHHDAIDIINRRYGLVAHCSCFISYGAPDGAFAQKLYKSLADHHVDAFYFPVSAEPGKKLHRVMREGVNQRDRVILICSKSSLSRTGVQNEIEETLQREAREGGKEILIPIRLDDYIFSGWMPVDNNALLAIRDRVVADFSETEGNSVKYHSALRQLLAALLRPTSGLPTVGEKL